MGIFLSIPAGVFLVLLGLLWEPQPKTRKDLKLERALAEAEAVDTTDSVIWDLTPRQKRNYLRRVAMRVSLVVGGILILAGQIIVAGLGDIDSTSAFALLLALYSGALLIVQRAEKQSRMLVFILMSFVGFMVWRVAEFRDHTGENNWAIISATLLNLVIWYFIGRRFPPANSDYIEVLGMEDPA